MKAMKQKCAVTGVLLVGAMAMPTLGSLKFEDFSLTDNTLSFSVSGTLTGLTPDSASSWYFVNPDTDPFVSVPAFTIANSFTWTGNPGLNASFPVITGNPVAGDYLIMSFNRSLFVGESISGTLTAEFSPGSFDPSVLSSLDIYWGLGSGGVDSGTPLGSVTVPAPSSSLALLGLAALSQRRRRS